MTIAVDATVAEAEVPPENDRPLRNFLRLLLRFWHGETRLLAWGLTLALGILIVGNVLAQYSLNAWSAKFFDAVEQKNTAALQTYSLWFVAVLAFNVFTMVALDSARMALQVQWRRWLTQHLIGRWLSDRVFYHLNLSPTAIDNPDARISEDARLAIEPVADLSIGFVNALLAAVTFLAVLWTVGGTVPVTVFGASFKVPGFFVFAAVLYGVLSTLGTVYFGRPLIAAVWSKNRAEANLRFELTRLREGAESIALMGGEAEERDRLSKRLTALVVRWWAVIFGHARVTLLTALSTVFLPVIPLLLGAPLYVSGAMSLGELMQVAAAFVQSQLALNWIANNFIRLSEWSASAQRVQGLVTAIDELRADDQPNRSIDVAASTDTAIHLVNLSVRSMDGELIIGSTEVTIEPGERVLISGESGIGKSTLLRALAGLWPWGGGRILVPAGTAIHFMPQRPYLPLGSLRTVLAYPNAANSMSNDDVVAALTKVSLEHLVSRLDQTERWDQVLSGGEQQRLAFAKLLVSRPSVVVMDESTSALDTLNQDRVMQALIEDLPATTIISVSHRVELERYHSRTLMLVRARKGAKVTQPTDDLPQRMVRLLGQLGQRWRN